MSSHAGSWAGGAFSLYMIATISMEFALSCFKLFPHSNTYLNAPTAVKNYVGGGPPSRKSQCMAWVQNPNSIDIIAGTIPRALKWPFIECRSMIYHRTTKWGGYNKVEWERVFKTFFWLKRLHRMEMKFRWNIRLCNTSTKYFIEEIKSYNSSKVPNLWDVCVVK